MSERSDTSFCSRTVSLSLWSYYCLRRTDSCSLSRSSSGVGTACARLRIVFRIRRWSSLGRESSFFSPCCYPDLMCERIPTVVADGTIPFPNRLLLFADRAYLFHSHCERVIVGCHLGPPFSYVYHIWVRLSIGVPSLWV